MTHITCTISAYDMLDQIQITARLIDWDRRPFEPDQCSLSLSTSIAGEGVTDYREWLRDALVGLLEAL